MDAHLHAIYVFLVLVSLVTCEPDPGRVPKVYNALISSNQNLEPSKAFPVYQPVLHDFSFPYQPVFYTSPDFPNLFVTSKGAPPQQPPQPQTPPALPENTPDDKNTDAPSEGPEPPQQPDTAKTEDNPTISPAPSASPEPPQFPPSPSQIPSSPPSTPSPIPLNEFGLPPQVYPLNRVDPSFNGFNQVSPFNYNYPGFRLYDPYDPFLNPYFNLPSTLYHPQPNGLDNPLFSRKFPGFQTPSSPAPSPAAPSVSSPPSEPDNLNILNYPSQDPSIPNVPPPPLPQGGLKADKSE